MIKKTNFTIDDAVLERATQFADEHHISRSTLITQALVQYMDMVEKEPIARNASAEFFQVLAQALQGNSSVSELHTRMDSIESTLKAANLIK